MFSRGGDFGMHDMEGAADLVLAPDPLTFKALPWAPHSGWLLCEAYFGNRQPGAVPV